MNANKDKPNGSYYADCVNCGGMVHATRKYCPSCKTPVAAAKEEQGKVLTAQEIDALCDAYHNYVKNRYPDQWAEMSTGFEAGVRAVADSGYLAPAKGSGLTVEGVMKLAEEHLFGMNTSMGEDVVCSVLGHEPFRKALEDLAGKE